MAGLIERYRARLPVSARTPVISLGEGGTPLVQAARLGAALGLDLSLKLEGMNPTGSFKDRGMTVAVSRALEAGARGVVCASTGNTAASAAAYAARAGLDCVVVVPRGRVAAGKLVQARICGARVVEIDGSFDEALARVRSADDDLVLVNNLNPDRLAGQKTVAFELCEAIGDAPDWVAVPVGNGGNVTAIWGGFEEALARGEARRPPRLLLCQAEGAAAVVSGQDVPDPQTAATAIRIGRPVRMAEAREAMVRSEGAGLALPDEAILEAQARLAREEGVFCEPASAAALAGVARARADGLVEAGARVTCILTGHGLKDVETAALASEEAVSRAGAAA
jgi:threonine synthase